MLRFLKNILQIILSPSNGWEEISHDGWSVERLSSEGLYPLMGIAALTAFVQGFYATEFELITLIQHAMSIFIVLFFAFWFGRSMMETYLNRYTNGEPGTLVGGTMAVYTTSLMCLIQILTNVMPIELPVLMLLPIFVAIIIWRGDRYLGIKQEMMASFIIFAIGVLIVPCLALNFILSLIF